MHVKPTWFMLVCAMLSMLSSMAKAPCCAAKACALKAPSLTAVTCVRLGAAGDDGCFFGGRLTYLTINKGVRNCFGNDLFSVFFKKSVFLAVFLAICSILELEAAISTVFATFWSWNLSFSIGFTTFWWN